MNILDYILIHFPKRDIEIYRMRYFEHKTLKEVGKILGLNQERVRQLEARTIEKMEKLSADISIKIIIEEKPGI